MEQTKETTSPFPAIGINQPSQSLGGCPIEDR